MNERINNNDDLHSDSYRCESLDGGVCSLFMLSLNQSLLFASCRPHLAS